MSFHYQDITPGLSVRVDPVSKSHGDEKVMVFIRQEPDGVWRWRRSTTRKNASGSRITEDSLTRAYRIVEVIAPEAPTEAPEAGVVVQKGDLELAQASDLRWQKVTKTVNAMARLLGEDAERQIKISSREIARLQGREHREVLRGIKTLITRGRGQCEFAPSSYLNDQNKSQSEYLCSVDGFRLVLKQGETEEAEIAREAEHILLGQLGRGEDTEATRINAESQVAGELVRAVEVLITPISQAIAALAESQAQTRADMAKMEKRIVGTLADSNPSQKHFGPWEIYRRYDHARGVSFTHRPPSAVGHLTDVSRRYGIRYVTSRDTETGGLRRYWSRRSADKLVRHLLSEPLIKEQYL